MTDTHTPGPWAIWNPINDADIDIHAEGHGQIATLFVAGPNPDRNKQQHANARLIAAAPETAAERDRLRESNAELFEALINMVALARPFFTNNTQTLAIDLSSAAIAKAEKELSR